MVDSIHLTLNFGGHPSQHRMITVAGTVQHNIDGQVDGRLRQIRGGFDTFSIHAMEVYMDIQLHSAVGADNVNHRCRFIVSLMALITITMRCEAMEPFATHSRRR